MNNDIGRREKPRMLISVPGRISTGTGVPYHVAIIDLSESGCRVIDTSYGIGEGSRVSIRVGRLDPIDATVCWKRSGEIGLAFQQPIYGPVFENIKAILEESKERPERRSQMRIS